MPRTIDTATAPDLAELRALIERAYRGDAARAGWTHEADLVTAPRTSTAALAAILADGDQHLLVARDGGRIVGSVVVARRRDGDAYLGQLCVDPHVQGAGVGGALVDAAEALARDTLGAATMVMMVIEGRDELIAWYVRRGYADTGERPPFPAVAPRPLAMVVLARPLHARPAA